MAENRTIAQPYRCLVMTKFECDCQVCRASREIDRLNAVIGNLRSMLADAARCSPGSSATAVVSEWNDAIEAAAVTAEGVRGKVLPVQDAGTGEVTEEWCEPTPRYYAKTIRALKRAPITSG